MIIVIARNIAEYTALTASTTPSAPITASGPNTQNVTASPVEVRVMVSCAKLAARFEASTAITGRLRRSGSGAGHSGSRCPGSNPCRWRPRPWGAAASAPPLVLGQGQSRRRAGLDAKAAADATQVVDLIHPAVSFPWREPRLVGVIRALDVDGVGGARP